MWRRFAVASTVVPVAGSGTLLLVMYCATRVRDTLGTVEEKINHLKSTNP